MERPYLRTVVIGSTAAQDPYFGWHRLREIDEAGALLDTLDGRPAVMAAAKAVGGAAPAKA